MSIKRIIIFVLCLIVVGILIASVILPLLEKSKFEAKIESIDVFNLSDGFIEDLKNRKNIKSEFKIDDELTKEILSNPKQYRLLCYYVKIRNISRNKKLSDIELKPTFFQTTSRKIISYSIYDSEGNPTIEPQNSSVYTKQVLIKINEKYDKKTVLADAQKDAISIYGSEWNEFLGIQLYKSTFNHSIM